MSTKAETTFYAGVNKHLPRHIYRVKMNNPYVGGIPDCWYSGNSGDLWIEYKWIPRVPQRGVVSPLKLLSPLQAKWLTERHAEGRSVGVIVGCPTGGVILHGITWQQELPAKQFNALVVSRLDLAQWIESQTTR